MLNIDYEKMIADCYTRTKYRQGTGGCVAFKEGAHWHCEQVVAWAVERWNAEVKNRPMVNVHRRSLDDAWRQVMRHFGGDPDTLVGPSHDALRAQITSTELDRMNGRTTAVTKESNFGSDWVDDGV